MCTCIHSTNKNHSYFGRNLDLDYDYNQKVLITKRNFPICFKKEKTIDSHYAFIGTGVYVNNFPLYADGMNEKGLAVATLNFPSYCVYNEIDNDKKNYAPYEIIPLLLATCKNIKEVKEVLQNVNIVDIDFCDKITNHPFHFLIADKKESIVLENTKEGMKIYDNPYGVLTNNPPFPYHNINVTNYLHLSNEQFANKLKPKIYVTPYSFGLDAFSLPGDFSSPSRFVKAVFVSNYLTLGEDEKENVLGFLNCLSQVSMPKGSVKTPKGYEFTRYSTCMNQHTGLLYYKTYTNPTPVVVDMFEEYLDANDVLVLPFHDNFTFIKQN